MEVLGSDIAKVCCGEQLGGGFTAGQGDDGGVGGVFEDFADSGAAHGGHTVGEDVVHNGFLSVVRLFSLILLYYK